MDTRIIYEIDSMKLKEKLNKSDLGQPRSSGHAPTTISPSIIKDKPDVYKTVIDGKQYIIKIIPAIYEKESSLTKECYALKALNRINISPHLYKKITLDNTREYHYLIYEYLEEDFWWDLVGLRKEILKNSRKKQISREIIDDFEKTLIKNVCKMHRLGIVHGDLKPSHIFIKKAKNSSIKKLKFIDFGLSYRLRKKFKDSKPDWCGGTIGYSPPNNWGYLYTHDLTEDQKLNLDYYGAYSSLFYLLTGEAFLLSYPAYNTLDENTLNKIRENLLDRYKNIYGAGEVIKLLCQKKYIVK